MFRPAPMVRLSALILERDERKLLQTLGHLGVVELTRAPAAAGNTALVTRDFAGELAQWQRVIIRAQELEDALGGSRFSSATFTPGELSLKQAEAKLAAMEQDVGDLLTRKRQLAERRKELETVDARLANYRGLELPLDQPDEISFLHFVTGSLPPGSFAKLQGRIGEGIALLPLPERHGRQPVIAMTTRRHRPALEKTLQAAGFEREILPVVCGGTVDTVSAADLREREQLEAEWQQGQRQLSVLAERFSGPLAELKWVAENESRLLAAGQQFARTESALLLSGWVPRAKVSQVEARLRAVTADRCVIELTAARDVPAETIPVLLQHPRWLRPFERLVAAYGLPQYREIEPTLFVALSYVVMFGVMFGDVGHGAILVLGGLLVMRQSRKAGRRDVGRLVLSGGISSLFFGLLYGSFFGLPAGKQYALWHDPLEGDPLELLTGTIGLGIVMISLGLVLNVINRWRQGDFIGGVLGRFGLAGAVFYWGGLLLLTQFTAIESRGLLVPAVVVFLALPVVAWTLKEPVEWLRNGRAGKAADPGGGLVAAFGESLVGAFEAALSFFANTISFVRLAAYAMSHAALLMAAFLLADAVKLVSPAGGGLAVLMVVLGNVVAILLEGVVASVQALRLEYYEFFGKFFGGGGQPFNPFRLQTPTVAEPPL